MTSGGTVGGTTGNTFPAGITTHTGVTIAADPYAGYPKPDGKSYNGVNTLPTNPARISGTTTALRTMLFGIISRSSPWARVV